MRQGRLFMVAIAAVVLLLLMELGGTEAIEDLDKSNFDEKTKEGNWFIEFYGPRCGHCKLLAKNWEKLDAQVKKEGLDVTIARVDAVMNAQLAKRFNATPWPSLKLYKNGEIITMENSREQHDENGMQNMLGFLKQHVSNKKSDL